MITLTSLTLAATGASDILQRGIDTSQGIAETWNKQWLNVFQSELYHSVVSLAGLFAAGALVFFMIQFIRHMVLEEDLATSLQSLLIPLVVIVLLANKGYLLGNSTLSLRNVIHGLSGKVLSQTLLEVKLQDAIQASVDKGSVSTQISALLSQCEGLVGQKQQDCFKSANQQAQAIIQDYQAKHPTGNQPFQGLTDWLNQLSQQANDFSQAQDGGISGSLFQGAGYLSGFLGAISQSLAQALLLAFQWAFANILEIALLLTGLMGPIAVAGALMYEGKSLWAWLTGFFAIGMAQVSYNIIVGLAAVVVVNANVTDTLGFLVIIAILAPALALALASGGGMVVFNIINAGSAGIAATLASGSPRVTLWNNTPLLGND
ncbi:MAG: hypothetical protein WCA35_29975 [Kovacikia sp.]